MVEEREREENFIEIKRKEERRKRMQWRNISNCGDWKDWIVDEKGNGSVWIDSLNVI